MSVMPNERYSQIVAFGIFLIQMTVPSIPAIYGTVLGHLNGETEPEFHLWKDQILLTPILFTAFWSLADPWARLVVDMATIPRLVALIGVGLLFAGILASGYLATGGAGAYLTSLSAGAAMGIGASLVIAQSDNVLRQCHRARLSIALFIKIAANSVGYIVVPVIFDLLLNSAGVKASLLLVTVIFFPTAFGASLLHVPVEQNSLPYSLLFLRDGHATSSTHLTTNMAESANEPRTNKSDPTNEICIAEQERVKGDVQPLFCEENNSYFYDESDEEVNIFVNTTPCTSTSWKEELLFLRSMKFWICTTTWITVRVAGLFFWTLSPLMLLTRVTLSQPYYSVMLYVIAGLGILIPCVLSCRSTNTTVQHRKVYFGTACWLGSVVSLGFTYGTHYVSFIICALFGGISIGVSLVYQESVFCDLLGVHAVQQIHRMLSTITGITVLLFCFIHDGTLCLQLIAVLQFVSGIYWIITSFLDNILKAQNPSNQTISQ